MNNLHMQMHVPEHIYATGTTNYKPRSKSQSSSNYEILTVPERITVGGNGTKCGAKVDPSKDIIRGKLDAISVCETNEVPSVITASNMTYHKNFPSSGLESASQSSTAIDENPIKELKILRRRLGLIANKIMDLEEENAKRQTRELGLWAILAGAIVALASLFLNRRR